MQYTSSGTSQSYTQGQDEVNQHIDTLVMGGKNTSSTNLFQRKLVLKVRIEITLHMNLFLR